MDLGPICERENGTPPSPAVLLDCIAGVAVPFLGFCMKVVAFAHYNSQSAACCQLSFHTYTPPPFSSTLPSVWVTEVQPNTPGPFFGWGGDTEVGSVLLVDPIQGFVGKGVFFFGGGERWW